MEQHIFDSFAGNGSSRNGIYRILIVRFLTGLEYSYGTKFTLFIQHLARKRRQEWLGAYFCPQSGRFSRVRERRSINGVSVVFQGDITPNRPPKACSVYGQNKSVVSFYQSFIRPGAGVFPKAWLLRRTFQRQKQLRAMILYPPGRHCSVCRLF